MAAKIRADNLFIIPTSFKIVFDEYGFVAETFHLLQKNDYFFAHPREIKCDDIYNCIL